MKKYPFRDHQITRSCETHYRDYHQYLSDLKRDFSNRCCYCNISDKTLGTTPFQIDHFIPKAKFVGTRDELLTQYNNLVLSCPKCNRSKGSQYTGNIHSDTIENSLFYNPDEVDYNTVFYRNELGGISSDDDKGKDMIKRLGLYRTFHHYAWLLEKIDCVCEVLENQAESTDDATSARIKELHFQLSKWQRKTRANFEAAYRT